MLNRLYLAYLKSHTVTTDSRHITPGCLFFAFRGEHFDGNAFAPEALRQGAAMCVISDPRYRVDDRCIVVDDVLKTLQDLAVLHRRYMTIPVIGITGTNGKTTTKELVHAVLARRYRTAATTGNHNNHLGVPLTLLGVPPQSEIAVVEMGANHPGEIEALCRIADPDCGLITNVGIAHIEGFGSFEGVVHTKTELYRHLAAKHGLVFVDADNQRLMDEASRLATIPPTESFLPAYVPANPVLSEEALRETPLGVVTYGTAAEADVRGTVTTADGNPYLRFYFEVGDNVYTVQTHLLGNYNFANCMAAVAVGLHFGVEPFDIKEAIEQYVPRNQRSEYRETSRGNRLYLDCYNANPSSMAAAINSFKSLSSLCSAPSAVTQDSDSQLNTEHCSLNTKKMAIIGGMHELGHEERKEHQKVVDLLNECHLDRALLIGPEFDSIDLPANMLRFPDTPSASLWLKENTPSNATILVKGSNTNRLWTLEELL